MAASAFLALPGAVDGSGPDAGVPAHYGNPLGEQRRLAAGEAIVDLSNRAVVSIGGPDRLSWLDSISSQRLIGLPPGESSETLLLDANGHVEHAVRLIDDGETLWLLIEGSQTEALLGFLQRMRFMLRVEPADRTAEFATIGFCARSNPADGPLIDPAVSNGVPLNWHDPWQAVARGGHQYAVTDSHPGTGWTWTETLVPRAALAGLARRAASGDLAVAGTIAVDALRIAAWRPRFATEVDAKTIPHELDWLRTAVHLSKGCYRGQETVAKVHNLGHPPRRLVLLHLDGSEGALPAPGSPVSIEREGEHRVVGQVTSSALHYELGPIALAILKRSTDATATLHVDAAGVDVAAAQELIVPTDAGAEANVPRLPRLGAVTRSKR
ncbi:CAF17-like 4Fe-4S cluster assembly/insertion protein YgfZ [Rathayibacter soli]|uniref:CAF17-like 4Fe-4S cluster assembly/insertion protein YgfZ n=1 Tax=Rathayibacter soli TaxID=3144168 RepID=UPI0027E3B6D3|nr:glycine cleavage T C-terminal barrel domain-containing protein [Glaciibacter superstes]